MVAKVDFYVFNFTRSAITELRFSAHSKAFLYAVQLQSNGKWQIPAACWFLRSISFLSSKQQSSERTFLQNRSTFPSRAGIERCFSSYRAPPVRPFFFRTKAAPSFRPEGLVYSLHGDRNTDRCSTGGICGSECEIGVSNLA